MFVCLFPLAESETVMSSGESPLRRQVLPFAACSLELRFSKSGTLNG